MKRLFVALLSAVVAGCLINESRVNVSALSFGDLEGRLLRQPAGVPLVTRRGEDTGNPAELSRAVASALEGTDCDTLLDATVTAKVSQGWFLWLSCGSSTLQVEGRAVRSADLPKGGVK